MSHANLPALDNATADEDVDLIAVDAGADAGIELKVVGQKIGQAGVGVGRRVASVRLF
jgi:hypothetical protein